MKVRIGYGLDVRTPTLDGGRFAELVDALEALRFDSLWLSGASPEPVPSPWSASRSPPLAPASSSWAPRCRCCPGATSISWPRPGPRSTASPAAGALPRSASASPIREQAAFGVARGDRARRFDEALPKLRALWAGEEVDGAAIAPLQSSPPRRLARGHRPVGAPPRGAARRRLAAVVLHAGRRRRGTTGRGGRGGRPRPDHRPRALGRADPVPG